MGYIERLADAALMADETELRRDANRAREAEALLGNPLLMEAFDTLAAQYVAAWLVTQTSDSVQREKLYFAARTLPAVKKNLETILMNGSIAAKQLANLEEDAKRNKR